MIIDFECVNGISGWVTDSVHIDTMTLSRLEIKLFSDMVRDADFFNLPEHIFRPGADFSYYRLTIRNRDKKHAVNVDMEIVPEKLQPLIEKLKEYIKKSKTPITMR